MKRFRIAGLALVLAAPAVSAQETRPLAVHGNMQTLELAPVLLAADRAPAEAVVRPGSVANLFPNAAPMAGQPVPGLADLATNAETQALRYSVAHPDLRIILTVSEGHYRIVAKRSAGIARLEDLKGKRIATIPPTSSGYFLHRMLAKAGLSEADVTIVPTVEMTKALQDGRVDAVTIWEPEIEKAATALGADAISFTDDKLYRELFNLNTSAAALADPRRRKRIVGFVRTLIQASADIRGNAALAQPLVVRASGFDAATIARSWHGQTYPGVLVPDLLDVLVSEEQWLAAQEKRAPRSRESLARLIDDSVAREAAAAP
jgi:sulfonate transport system substrate-binding protein